VGAERVSVRADFVDHVAVGADPVRAQDHRVDGPACHEEGTGAVHGNPEVDAEPGQLPRGQPRSLQQRARLARHHAAQGTAPVKLDDDAERGPTHHRGQPAGVAVGEQAGSRTAFGGHEVGAQPGHRCRGGDLLVAQGERLGQHGIGTVGQPRRRAPDPAGQIHRRRARGLQPADVFGQRVTGMPAGGERNAERAGHPERRRAAHRQRADRRDDLVGRVQPQHDRPLGQGGLVDDLDRPVHPVDGAHAATLARAAFGHARSFTSGRARRARRAARRGCPSRSARCPTSRSARPCGRRAGAAPHGWAPAW
jgi:hypothetical protein